MAEEHISRGHIIRIVQKISLRHPRGLTKEWLYSILKPVVEALEADLKALQPTQEPESPAPTGNEPATPAVQTDLRGDTAQTPVEERAETKKGNKPKEKKK